LENAFVEYTIIQMTPTASRYEKQCIRVAPGEPYVFADVRRDGYGARFAGLHGVGAAPRAIFSRCVPARRMVAVLQSASKSLRLRFGNLTESQAAPSGQQYQGLNRAVIGSPLVGDWRATRRWS